MLGPQSAIGMYRVARVSASGADCSYCLDCNFALRIGLCFGAEVDCACCGTAGVQPVGRVCLLVSLLSGSFDSVWQVGKVSGGEVRSAQPCGWLRLNLH